MKNLKRLFALVMALCLCLSATAFAAEMEDTSGTVGDSSVTWRLDDLGRLFIGGEGDAPVFTSKEDQPWAGLRDQIREVWYDDMEATHIPDLAYWFTDCTALESAEIPYTTKVIGKDAFAGCASLSSVLFYYQDADFRIEDGAFRVEAPVKTTLYTITQFPDASIRLRLYDWVLDNREFELRDVYSTMLLVSCGLSECTCTGPCDWYYYYASIDATTHRRYIKCDGCGEVSWITADRDHTFSGNTCTDCGYTKSGGSSGGGGTDTCYHRYTTKEWYGCDWEEYCDDCYELVDWGTAHGTSRYGSWQYYDTSEHRRTEACRDCGEDLGYDYGYHSTTDSYAKYNDTQHKVTSYCSLCASNIGSASYESHDFDYGTWTSYSAGQHRRTKDCSPCGFSSYDYGSHTDSNGDGKCDTCSYSLAVTVTWDAGSNGGTVGGSSSVTTSVTPGSVATPPSGTPVKTGYTFKGWYTAASGGSLYSSVTVSSARTFYAQFTPASYSITWDLGDGRTESTSQSYGERLTLPTTPAKEGYTFNGWFTAKTGGTEVTSSTVYTGTSGTTYYAHWSANSYTVTWDMGDGTTVTTDQAYDQPLVLPSVTPDKEGHTFDGWFTAETGGTKVTEDTIYTESSDTTYHAHFTPKHYTITWDLGDGNRETTSQEYGAILVLPTEPAKDGYTFGGWFTEAEGGTEVTGSTIYTTDSESVFYAHWTRVMVFSATVPVTLPMSVSENGTVHTATNHAIQNNSTGAIAVTGITVTAANGWSLVPVDTDMAAQKVDAKLLGFSLNGAETTARGDTQALSLAGGIWTIPEAEALALDYDAVVSAMSKAVTDEAVLSVVFVLEWA